MLLRHIMELLIAAGLGGVPFYGVDTIWFDGNYSAELVIELSKIVSHFW
jgi:alpha-glucosidase (family GH31 glycosyl hydrolase)